MMKYGKDFNCKQGDNLGGGAFFPPICCTTGRCIENLLADAFEWMKLMKLKIFIFLKVN